MAVAVTIDIPGGNEQFYEQMVAKLFPDGKLPEGWLVHLAGPTESGWRGGNVVPSQEQVEVFAREQLIPAVQEAENVTPKLTYFPVYRLIRNLREGPPCLVHCTLTSSSSRTSHTCSSGPRSSQARFPSTRSFLMPLTVTTTRPPSSAAPRPTSAISNNRFPGVIRPRSWLTR